MRIFIRFVRFRWRLSMLILTTAIASVAMLRLYLPTDAQAGANCSTPYLVDKSFTNGARWQLCWEQRNLDGIVLRDVYFTPPGGSQRRILAEGSISQVHVPYDDNSARFHDITDDGFGNENLSDLTPEECPGGTLLKDGTKDVICQQFQLRGYAVKGLGVEEEGEWLSLFSVSTSGEYNYIPVWRFLDDGTLEMVMGATGKLQRFTTDANFGWPVRANGTLGTAHIHNYYWRLDFDLGEKNDDEIVEEFNYMAEVGQSSPRRSLGITQLTSEAGRAIAPQTMRSWRIRDGLLTNEHGRPISYQLEPINVGHRDVGPSSEPWTANDFYVTKYNACEKYVSHNPQTGGCGNNLAAFVNGESLANSDLVLWYGVTFHHIPRDEDEAFMHAHWDGFRFVPRDLMASSPTATTLVTCAVGDVTCDATVDAADALYMLQQTVQLRTISTQLPLPANTLYGFACDVSGEGACNQVDALLTLQCAVGLPNRFCPGSGGLQSNQATSASTGDTTLILGPMVSDTTSAPINRIPIWVEAPTTVGSLSTVLRYDPSLLATVTCQATKASMVDMALCSVDPTTGTVRFSALATAGSSGRLAVGEVSFVFPTEITNDPLHEGRAESLLRVEAIQATDTTGNAMLATVQVPTNDHWLYLPFVQR